MNTIGNVIWLLFGGIVIAIEYLVGGIILCATIIGIPFGFQAFKLAGLALWPFGKDTQIKEPQSGCLNTLFNVIWILVGGIWIFLSHIVMGVLLGITIIGIPFARQHFKLAVLAITPFGREIVYIN